MQIILLSAFACTLGTGLGGIIAVVIGNHSPSMTMTCRMLSFAGGVMTSIVCFGLIPEAIGLSNLTLSVLGIVLGILVIMLLNRFVDGVTEKAQSIYHSKANSREILDNKKVLLRSGIIMLIALALHNIPEGMAIGAGGSHDIEFGVMLAIMIALHDVPEGMAIAAPLLGGGLNKAPVIFLTALSGTSTFIGGTIGVLIGNISDNAVALSLSAAGGAMLYVVFGEIIPQVIIMTKSRMSTLIMLFGIILGLIVAQI